MGACVNKEAALLQEFQKIDINIGSLADLENKKIYFDNPRVLKCAKESYFKTKDFETKMFLISVINKNKHYKQDTDFESDLLNLYPYIAKKSIEKKLNIEESIFVNFFLCHYNDHNYESLIKIIKNSNIETSIEQWPLLYKAIAKTKTHKSEYQKFLRNEIKKGRDFSMVLDALGVVGDSSDLEILKKYEKYGDAPQREYAKKSIKKIEKANKP